MFILSNPEPSLGVAKIHAYLMVQWGFDTIKLRKKCTFKSQIFFTFLINSHSKTHLCKNIQHIKSNE